MNISTVNFEIYLDLSLYDQILILIISYFSNFFSAISGGGAGLIQLPALLLFGVPYYKALAAHKISTVALGIGGSTRNFSLLKNRHWIILQILLSGIPGVIVGASIVNFLKEEYLYFLLAIFSIFLGIYSFKRPSLGIAFENKKLSLLSKIKFNLLIFFIGILNGSISSGTGLFVTILLIKTIGIDFLSAISITFLTVGIFWNFIGAIALSSIGSLPLNLLIILILGSFLGGISGAHLSNLKGNKLIKKFFTSLCFLIGLSLLFKFCLKVILS